MRANSIKFRQSECQKSGTERQMIILASFHGRERVFDPPKGGSSFSGRTLGGEVK